MKTRNINTLGASRRVRLGAAQLPAAIEGRSFKEKQEQNLRGIVEMIREAGEKRVDLLLFGEYANLHHRTWSKNKREYVPDPIPGRVTDIVGEAAAESNINVAFPMFGIYRKRLSSHVVLFDRTGEIAGCYQKTHPTIAEQQLGIVPGKDLQTFQLDIGRVGIMTCMDIEYPEAAQVLMLRGAELLLFPHVQSGWGEVDWEIRYRARAIDTGLPLLSACYGYPEGEWGPSKMVGRSGVIGRDGGILAEQGRGIGLVTCEIDLEEKRMTHFFFTSKIERTLAVTASRRPDLYKDLADEKLKETALRKVPAKLKDKRKKH